MKLGEQHLLARVDTSALAAVPAGGSSPSGTWVGVSARVSALVYNTSALSPSQLPSSVTDLANPGDEVSLVVSGPVVAWPGTIVRLTR